MIDVSQWRASIGLWNYCQAASRGSIVFKKYCRPASSGPASECCQDQFIKATTEESESDTTDGYIQEEKRCTLPAVLFMIGFIVIYFCLLLLKHNSIPPPGHCYCYQVQCTSTGDIVTDTLQSVVLPGDINISLMSRLLLLLSGDVELNPGPTVEACTKVKEVLRSHYAVLEEATKSSLSSIMSHLYAKGIITESVRDSLSYSKMMQEFQAKLLVLKDVSELKAHCQVFLECISQGGPTDAVARILAIEWGEVFDMESLLPMMSSTPSPSTTGLSKNTSVSEDLYTALSPAYQLNLSASAGGISQDITTPFKSEASEEKVYKSLDDLHQKFSNLAKVFKSSLREEINHNSQLATDVSEWLIEYMEWEHNSVDDNIDDIFKKIRPYYDFIDCKLLLDMSNEFLPDLTFINGGATYKLVDELHSHTLMSKRLRTSNTVSALKKLLQEHYKPFDKDMDNIPCINIQLQTYWNDISIKGLYKLLEKLLPQEYRQSIVKHITIFSGSVVIKLHILDITADSLIEYNGRSFHKLQFMYLIGVFSLYINDHPVLQEDENMKFTFELALLEAVTAGNNEAVEFLLQLETVNIDHTNEEGKTALMLASERGHEDIVLSLLIAGANVNIEDNKGWTALMIGSKHNHISIIHMLLQANANPQLKTSDGSNAVMIASGNGNYEVVELLISKGVDYKYQREDGVNAFMMACRNGHTQIVELLLKVKVDPNVQKEDGKNAFMLACLNGHTQIVELLLKEKVDPNVQDKDGWNAFVLACQNGHTQIVELLLKVKVNPNVQDKDGWNAFMSACQNGHTQIVELLLKEQVDLNAPDKDGRNAFMLACQNGHTQVVELLLKEQVDPNVQEKDGWNAFMLACQNGHTQIVELLLKEQVDPNVQSQSSINPFISGLTPLMIASYHGHIQPVRLLLIAGADPNKGTMTGETALGVAVKLAHYEIVDELIKAGASTNISMFNPINNTIIDYSITQYCVMEIGMNNTPVNEMKQIIQNFVPKQLQDNLAKNIDLQQIKGQDETKHIRILQLLLEVTPQPEDDTFSLLAATEAGCTPAVELLLKAGYDPLALQSSSRLHNIFFKNTKNTFFGDYNALMMACQKGYIEIVQLMFQGPVAITNICIYNPISNTTINCTITQWCVIVMAMKDTPINEMNEIMQNFKLQDDVLKSVMDMGLQQIRAQDETKYIKILQLLLEATPQPEDDPASLIMASISGNVQAVELLLKAGYNPKAPLSSSKYFQAILPTIVEQTSLSEEMLKISCPSLVFACIRGHLEVFKLLLKEISDSNHQQETGETFLMLACDGGHKDIVLTLLENGADPNICDNNGNNTLHHALMSNSSEDNIIDIIQTLMSWNIDVNAQNNNGVTLLMIASVNGYTEVLVLLLEEADPNITDSKGRTALMYASSNGQSEAVALLLMTYNADPIVTDNYESTAFCHAVYGGHNEVINVLLNNYNPNQEEIEKAFTAACYGGHEDPIKFLADKINLTKHQSDLLTACMSDDVEFINNQTPSDLCTPLIESTGLTPLMIAASCGSDEVVRTLLLIHGADVNQQDTYLNYTPLLYAISSSKSISIVQHLLDSGANVNAYSKEEETPLDIARDKGLNEIAKILENKGGVTSPSVTVEKVEQLSTRQKTELLLGLLMIFSQMQTLPTTASMRESFQVPSFTSVPILV